MLRRAKALLGLTIATATVAILGTASPAAVASSCPHGYASATINHAHKCLHAGEYCTHSYQSQYRHYHYTCVVVGGHYRLKRS